MSPIRSWERYPISGELVWNYVGFLAEYLTVSAAISISTLLLKPTVYLRRRTGSSLSGDLETLSRPIIPLPKLGNVFTGILPLQGTWVSARSTPSPVDESFDFMTVLEFSTNDLNNFFYYVPRPHLPQGIYSVAVQVIGTLVTQIVDRRPYNQVTRCATDSQYDPSPMAEDLTMLYRPLYWTSFWCEDWLFTSNYRGGAKLVFISSASSKTAFCLAHCIRLRIRNKEIPAETRIIGFTSKRNTGFTKRLGLYHEVVSYDDINDKAFDFGVKTIYADVAGSDDFNRKLLAVQGPVFVAAVKLGMSNVTPTTLDVTAAWTKNTTLEDAAGLSDSTEVLEFENFFMVEWLAVRVKQLSVKEIAGMQAKAWKQLLVDAKGWVEITRVYGGEKVKTAYDSALKNGLRAEDGYVWSLWDEQMDGIKTGAKCRL